MENGRKEKDTLVTHSGAQIRQTERKTEEEGAKDEKRKKGKGDVKEKGGLRCGGRKNDEERGSKRRVILRKQGKKKENTNKTLRVRSWEENDVKRRGHTSMRNASLKKTPLLTKGGWPESPRFSSKKRWSTRPREYDLKILGGEEKKKWLVYNNEKGK